MAKTNDTRRVDARSPTPECNSKAFLKNARSGVKDAILKPRLINALLKDEIQECALKPLKLCALRAPPPKQKSNMSDDKKQSSLTTALIRWLAGVALLLSLGYLFNPFRALTEPQPKMHAFAPADGTLPRPTVAPRENPLIGEWGFNGYSPTIVFYPDGSGNRKGSQGWGEKFSWKQTGADVSIVMDQSSYMRNTSFRFENDHLVPVDSIYGSAQGTLTKIIALPSTK